MHLGARADIICIKGNLPLVPLYNFQNTVKTIDKQVSRR